MSEFRNEFGGRLKTERDRFGMNQAAFAEIGGVAKLSQLKYEKGERMPSADYLHALYQWGVDVGYLITGVSTTRGPGGPLGIAVDPDTLRKVIELIELGLQASGISWPAKFKAGVICSLLQERDVFQFEYNDNQSKVKAAEALIKVFTQLGPL